MYEVTRLPFVENNQAHFCIVKITDITEKTWSNLN